MSCAFDLEHYRELLDAAKAGGYRFACFDGEPSAGDLLPPPRRRPLARRRAADGRARGRGGRRRDVLPDDRSVFYNLASPEGERAIARLRELGHRVGLHAVYPTLDLDERFDPVVAWHNPDPRVHDARRSTARST